MPEHVQTISVMCGRNQQNLTAQQDSSSCLQMSCVSKAQGCVLILPGGGGGGERDSTFLNLLATLQRGRLHRFGLSSTRRPHTCMHSATHALQHLQRSAGPYSASCWQHCHSKGFLGSILLLNSMTCCACELVKLRSLPSIKFHLQPPSNNIYSSPSNSILLRWQ